MTVETTRRIKLVPLEEYEKLFRRLEKAEKLIEQLDHENARLIKIVGKVEFYTKPE